MQVSSDEAPSAVENFPAGHSLHKGVVPFSYDHKYSPAPHDSQTLSDAARTTVENFPNPHKTHDEL